VIGIYWRISGLSPANWILKYQSLDGAGHVIQLLNVFHHLVRKYDRHQGVRKPPEQEHYVNLDDSVLAAFITPITANRVITT
jgi:hypothetical protein